MASRFEFGSTPASELDVLEKKLAEMKVNLKKSEKVVQDYEEINTSFQDENEKLKEDHEKLTEECDAVQFEKLLLITEVERIKDDLNSKNLENVEMEVKIEETDKLVQSYVEIYTASQEYNKGLEAEKLTLTSELKKLSQSYEELNKASHEHTNGLEAEKSILATELEKTKDQKSMLATELEKLAQSYEELNKASHEESNRAFHEHVKGLEAEKLMLATELEKTKDEKSILATELEKLAQNHEETNKASHERTKGLEAEKLTLATELEKTKDDLKSKNLGNVAEMEVKLKEAETLAQSYEETNKASHEHAKGLEVEKLTLATELEKTKDDLKSRNVENVAEVEVKLKEAEKLAQSHEQMNKAFHEHNKGLEAENLALATELEKAKDDIKSKIPENVAEMEVKLKKVEKLAHDYGQMNKAFQKDIEKLETEKLVIATQLEKTKDTLKTTTQQNEADRRYLEVAEEEVQAKEALIKEREATIAKVQKTSDSRKNTAVGAEKALTKEREKVKELQKKATTKEASYKQSLDSLKKKLEQSTPMFMNTRYDGRRKMADHIEILEDAREQWNQITKGLEEDCANVKALCEDHEKVIEDLKANKSQFVSEKKKLATRNCQLEIENQTLASLNKRLTEAGVEKPNILEVNPRRRPKRGNVFTQENPAADRKQREAAETQMRAEEAAKAEKAAEEARELQESEDEKARIESAKATAETKDLLDQAAKKARKEQELENEIAHKEAENTKAGRLRAEAEARYQEKKVETEEAGTAAPGFFWLSPRRAASLASIVLVVCTLLVWFWAWNQGQMATKERKMWMAANDTAYRLGNEVIRRQTIALLQATPKREELGWLTPEKVMTLYRPTLARKFVPGASTAF